MKRRERSSVFVQAGEEEERGERREEERRPRGFLFLFQR